MMNRRRKFQFEIAGSSAVDGSDSAAGIGLQGQYYDNADLTGTDADSSR